MATIILDGKPLNVHLRTVRPMKISTESIDAIRQAAGIVDVVSEYVTLTKKGKNYVAFCPFEDWRSSLVPLFIVSIDPEYYKCFCCGASGDAAKFVMDIEGISYEAALRKLAAKFNITIIEETR
jgi:DNA primase